MKKSGFFWVSYADLMTSLFFVMLVLYIVSFTFLQSKQGILEAQAHQLAEIKNVQKAIESLDTTYYQFDKENKRYKLNIDAKFRPNSSNLNDISKNKRNEIAKAGKNLYDKIASIIDTSKTIDYLLIIEGSTQRYNNNWKDNPNLGYQLSYQRALSLYNYWKQQGADFRRLGAQCEVIIAGSGYFSQSRDEQNENNNRRFTIQVTSKVGKFLHSKEVPIKEVFKEVNESFFDKLFN